MLKKKYYLLMSLLALAFVGCVNIPHSVPAKDVKHYSFDLERPALEKISSEGLILRPQGVIVSSQFDDIYFTYRIADNVYKTDYYNQFIAPPSTLFSEDLIRWFSRSEKVGFVISPRMPIPNAYILDGVVSEIYGDYRNESDPKAVLVMRFSLLKETSGKLETVFQKSYPREIPLSQISTDALFEGWTKALREILTELENDINKVE